MGDSVEVIALDPGGVTGWAVLCIGCEHLLGNTPLHSGAIKIFTCGQIVGPEIHQADQIVDLVDAWPDAAVVTEGFIQRIRNTGLETDVAYSPVRINAIINWWLAADERRLYRQSPSDAKGMWSDDRLNKAGLVVPKGHEHRHARDAARHAALFVTRVRSRPGFRSMVWPELYPEEVKK